jgi:hypothetical protein
MSAIALNSGNVRFRAIRHAVHMTTMGAQQTAQDRAQGQTGRFEHA